MSIKEKLKESRENQNISIKELSTMTGISCSTIINIEKGHHKPTYKTLYKICSCLNLDFEELITERKN